ncbi:glucose-methanol-choline oxidoreductase [Histoplasma capsulatum]|uniref:Glucose-methanol-choline oxidoreductase n=1 Tax=Ajellomyces capsulatus TaxID=5037 RepID=A0A8A1MIZ2_AJECA|nr:glucose-methanol-choline oxidoreductase [Histoplasma capsulatum]
MTDTYDFIIVGGGNSGLLFATRLATALPESSVVVLESGSAFPDNSHLCQYDRYHAWQRPDLDLGYITTPQTSLKGRVLPYLRGKGPGGCTNVNFLTYTRGSAEDYNYWAELVGDDSWKWEHTLRRFKEIETFHAELSEDMKKYSNPLPENHGYNGPVHVSLPAQWENGITELLDAGTRYGLPLNMDTNSGNPIGLSIPPTTTFKGYRWTSEAIYTNYRPANLKMLTDIKVAKVVFENKVAVGIQAVDGRNFTANKEVILSAGVFDSAKILLLSGIGPTQELSQHNIQTIHDLPGVGKGLSDHPLVVIGASFAPGVGLSDRTQFDSNPAALEAAREQWKRDGTGEINLHRSCVITGWLKENSILTTSEYQNLDTLSKQYLTKDSVPHYELFLAGPHFPPTYVVPEGTSYLSTVVCLMNMQSRGEITLKSANVNDPPAIDSNYMSHPFDRKMLTLAIREAMKFYQSGAIEKEFKGYVLAPKSQSDEDIHEFIDENLLPVFHANGTLKMGKADDPMACTDPSFRIYGVEKLRVVDLSVCPITPNNHSQPTAYLVAQTAAGKIIAEYGGRR